MRQVREVLRLYYATGMSARAIARSLKVSPAVPAKAGMGKCIRRAEARGVSWPLPDSVDDAGLEWRLFPAPSARRRAMPRWSEVHRELRRKGVTLALLWEEDKAAHPEGLQYSWFCEQYRAWASRLDVGMRQEHRAGEKRFVDYAGHTVGGWTVTPGSCCLSADLRRGARGVELHPRVRGDHVDAGLGGVDCIAELLERLNARAFRKLPGARRSLFEQLDRPALRPLPTERYVFAEWKQVRVNIDYHVEVCGEPPRVSRRLHSLSLWEEKADDFTDKILPGSPGAGSAAGAGSPG